MSFLYGVLIRVCIGGGSGRGRVIILFQCGCAGARVVVPSGGDVKQIHKHVEVVCPRMKIRHDR